MAFNPAPSAIWPGCSFDGVNFKIPLSVLDLTESEAMDWREFLRALLWHEAQYVASLPRANRTKAVVTSSPQLFTQVASLGAGEARLEFDVLFNVSFETHTFTG